MSDTEWKDKPDGDGWWWRYSEDVNRFDAFFVSTDQIRITTWTDAYKWLRMPKPAEPPKPLPKSRTVELRARIYYKSDVQLWACHLLLNGQRVGEFSGPSKSESIKHVRTTWGIEPEVVT